MHGQTPHPNAVPGLLFPDFARLVLRRRDGPDRGHLTLDREAEGQHPGHILPLLREHEIAVSRVLTDRGTEYCGKPESHPYELCLAVENIDYTRTKARSPQTKGIYERFNKTALTEFYQVALRKKLYRSVAELQADLDDWMRDHNTKRTHQGRWCFGKTPMQTFVDMLPIAGEKLLQVA